MGIKKLVASYTTTYGGEANRLHNVRLVAQLVDRHLIPPGAEFSFNRTTGERTVEKGFLEAPVIINGELQTGLGGGVCQVSTTVFNAAFEAGLPITARTNHSLYISHYPTGRDATVNYPDLDLRFVNDTGKWLLLRTFVGSSSLTVALYGTPVNRRIEVETAPLRVTAEPSREADPGPGATGRRDRVSRATASRPARRACAAGSTRRREAAPRQHVVVLLRVRAADRPRGHEAEAQAEAASSPDHHRGGRPDYDRRGRADRASDHDRGGAAAASTGRRAPELTLRPGDRLDQEGGHARRPERLRVDAGVARRAVGDQGVVTVHRVLEAEACAADIQAARADLEPVREARGRPVADARVHGRGVHPRLEQRRIAALEAREVVDPRDLEPDEIRRVMGDGLGVGLREPHRHLRREAEAVHAASLRSLG